MFGGKGLKCHIYAPTRCPSPMQRVLCLGEGQVSSSWVMPLCLDEGELRLSEGRLRLDKGLGLGEGPSRLGEPETDF